MNYNSLSGAKTSIEKRIYMEMFQSGSVYLGFARKSPSWGTCSLLKIQHQKTFPADVMIWANDITQFDGDRFVDSNSALVYPTGVDAYRYVHLGRIGINDDIANPATVITYISTETPINLNYMGKEWAQVQWMDSTWKPTAEDIGKYKYYLFNHNQSRTSAVLIEGVEYPQYPSMFTPCKLAHSNTNNLLTYNEIYDEIDTGSLERVLNSNGELVVTGLKSTFADTIPTEGTFFLIDSTYGFTLLAGMTYLEKATVDGNTVILFELLINEERFQITLTTETNTVNRLAVFHEAAPVKSVTVNVSDANPPGLASAYIKNDLVSSSIFGVLGFQQVTSSDVLFVKEVINSTELGDTDVITLNLDVDTMYGSGTIRASALSNTILAFEDHHTFAIGDLVPSLGAGVQVTGFNLSDGAATVTFNKAVVSPVIGTVVTATNPRVIMPVHYHTTNDIDTALDLNYENVYVNMESIAPYGTSSPTEEIYRQIFLCYKPKKADMSLITEAVYNSSIFQLEMSGNNATGEYKYDIGSLIYLANKVPVYRKYITEESFKLII